MIERTERGIPIPVRMSNGAPGNRSCTSSFKIRVVDKWIKSQDITHAIVGLGISLDEYHRMKDENWHDHRGERKFGFMKKREHPLIDLRIRRQDCYNIIMDVGMPVPPKSSCFFCPFMKRSEWIEMKRNDPDLFNRAVEIEDMCNQKRLVLGRDRVYLHPSCTPLEQAVGDQMLLPGFEPDDDDCGGYCHT